MSQFGSGQQSRVESRADRGPSADVHSVARNLNAGHINGAREDRRILRTAAIIDYHNSDEQIGGQILQQTEQRFGWLVGGNHQRFHFFLRANFKPVQSSSTAQIL